MPAPLAPLTPWLFTAGFGWLYYRRIRRQFGRQVYHRTRTLVRIVLLSLIVCGLLFAAATLPHVALGVAGGIAAGGILGALALRHTRIAIVGGIAEYTPNAWIGGALSLLLIGRLAWRWYSGAFSAGGDPGQMGQNASPLTLAVMATLITYYLVSGIGLFVRMRRLHLDTPNPP